MKERKKERKKENIYDPTKKKETKLERMNEKVNERERKDRINKDAVLDKMKVKRKIKEIKVSELGKNFFSDENDMKEDKNERKKE